MAPDRGSPSEMDTMQGAAIGVELQCKWVMVTVTVVPGMGGLTWAQGQEGFCS
jgi:hypothetical protein